MSYRPWGELSWTLDLSTPKEWFFIGCLGTEERSIAGIEYVRSLGLSSDQLFAEVIDVDSEKYREINHEVLNVRREAFEKLIGSQRDIKTLELLTELFQISSFIEPALQQESVILDVTSLPKRFFFPILRRLLNAPRVKNLTIIYTSPSNYAADAPLYEDIEQWKVLPGFGGAGLGNELWIVSVGFLVESLRSYVSTNPHDTMKLLIPFPAPLPVLRRTWESVATLECELPPNRFEKFRIEPLDISSAFDRVCSLAGNPAKNVAFAPYGPKPTSVAMCLYAIQRNSSVHYAQPTIYHPHYSIGIRENDYRKAITAYWIKHEGENLFLI